MDGNYKTKNQIIESVKLYIETLKIKEWGAKMEVLITGAQFCNKGAQSLLCSVVNELKSRYNNIIIYYVPIDDFKKYIPEHYRFVITYDDKSYLDRSFNVKLFLKRCARCFLDALYVSVRLKARGVKKYSEVIRHIDILIDISGFALSDKFPITTNNRYLRYIEDAKEYGAKVILMPQSFGPFNYKDEKSKIDRRIMEVLQKADLIFAREKEGKDFLENIYRLSNIELSFDTVLQASSLKRESVFVNEAAVVTPIPETNNNVGIIPNEQTVRHGDETKVLKVYREIINRLLVLKRHIYIFRHSNDLELCKKIYAMFEENESVHLIEDEMDCIAYSEFVRNFDYIIASRYHAIIHAYKEHIPAIILGWAVKYTELAENFDQCQYVFDLNNCDVNAVLKAVDEMDSHFIDEQDKIASISEKTKQNSCFDKCWQILDNIAPN